MPDKRSADIMRRADDLDHRIEDHAPAINDLTAYARKSRRMVHVVFVLFVMMALVVFKVNDNANRLAHADDVRIALADTLRSSCAADNTDKIGEAELWNFLLALPPPPDETAERKTQRAAVAAIIVRIFAQSDCSALQEITP